MASSGFPIATIVESGVAKQTLEDTPDNVVQFITPVGLRETSS